MKQPIVIIDHKTRSGFTLVELSIVLVIIGLVVGGVIIGKDLIRNAELRAIISDVDRFKTSIATFKIKYNALPGDTPNATTYFGNTVSNGNGNSKIDYLGGAVGEEYYVWQHLGAASMLAGTYDGTTTNLPKSKLTGGLYRISFQTGIYQSSGTMISYNSMNTAYNLAHNAILTPQEAFSIDGKLDDGLADKGKVLAFNPEGVPGCITNYHTSSTGSYILTNTGVLCKLYFILDF